MWTQDGAPSHAADKVQAYLEQKLGSKGFWPKTMWPPSYPNLNPLDYHVWHTVEDRACSTYHSNVEALKVADKREWNNMSGDMLVHVCRRFRSRVERCIAAEGSIFEK